jgi:hypothetical protein
MIYEPDEAFSNTVPQTARQAAKYKKGISRKNYLLHIRAAYPRKGSDESCISELFPVYLD